MKLTRDISVTSRPLRRQTCEVLSLDFERQDYRRSGARVDLNSVLNFARDSVAIQVNDAGVFETVGADVLRRDHSVGNGAFLGALFEQEATNLLRHSNDFSQSYWVGYATKPGFDGGQTAPDGTATASSWNCADTVGGAGGKRGGILVPDSGPAGVSTASVWLRASQPVTMRFGHSDSTSGNILVTPTWQRFSYSNTLPNPQNRIFMLYEDVNTDVDIYIWGAQVEYGSVATTPVVTTGSVSTRYADQPGLTGINGVFDVTVTYDDGSVDAYGGETITEGWWPVLSRPRVKKLVVRLPYIR